MSSTSYPVITTVTLIETDTTKQRNFLLWRETQRCRDKNELGTFVTSDFREEHNLYLEATQIDETDTRGFIRIAHPYPSDTDTPNNWLSLIHSRPYVILIENLAHCIQPSTAQTVIDKLVWVHETGHNLVIALPLTGDTSPEAVEAREAAKELQGRVNPQSLIFKRLTE